MSHQWIERHLPPSVMSSILGIHMITENQLLPNVVFHKYDVANQLMWENKTTLSNPDASVQSSQRVCLRRIELPY